MKFRELPVRDSDEDFVPLTERFWGCCLLSAVTPARVDRMPRQLRRLRTRPWTRTLEALLETAGCSTAVGVWTAATTHPVEDVP